MDKTLLSIIAAAGKKSSLLALPEPHDPRIIEAACRIREQSIARPVLIPDLKHYKATLAAVKKQGIAYAEFSLAEVISDTAKLRGADAMPLVSLAKAENQCQELIAKSGMPARIKRMVNPEVGLDVAALLLRSGLLDSAVAGSTTASAKVIGTAFRIVGLSPDIQTLTSCFLMLGGKQPMIYADCAIIPQPSSVKLADIAIAAASMHRKLLGTEPKVALLSFSTHGSAEHELVDRVKDAVEILKQRKVDFEFDGELQFDAATVAEVSKLKAPNSKIAGKANVFIFPDLNSGNIGYKIAQRLGNLAAIGPLLLGSKKALMDLSRGASVDDIVAVSAIAALMSNSATQ